MGVWGGLCVFDHTRFIEQLLPALRSGAAHPLVAEAIQTRGSYQGRAQPDFVGLAEVMASCDSAGTACSLGQRFYLCDGQLTWQPRPSGSGAWGYEDLAGLFEWLLTSQAISHFTITGLSFYRPGLLFPVELGLDESTNLLLDELDSRSSYWAGGSGGYGEGIRGWLDPSETELLELGLEPFAGPPTPHETAAAIWQRLWSYLEENVQPAALEQEYLRQARYIAAFREVLEIATTMERGVIWGRDLRLFYEHDRLFAGSERKPIKISR